MERQARPLRGLLPDLHRPGQPESASGSATRWSRRWPETGEDATCSLWLCAMDPADPARNVGVKSSLPASSLTAETQPFRLARGRGLAERPRDGGRDRAGRHAVRVGARAGTRACPPTDTSIRCCARPGSPRRSCSCRTRTSSSAARSTLGERPIEVSGARGGQAHLWGSKHATRWAWVHCNDFTGGDGAAALGHVRRRRERLRAALRARARPQHPGRRARSAAATCSSISPLRGPTQPERLRPRRAGASRQGTRRPRRGARSARAPEDLVGVTYHDPDGELAYCYNTEVADMRLEVLTPAVAAQLGAGRRAHAPTAAPTSSTRSGRRSTGVELKIR